MRGRWSLTAGLAAALSPTHVSAQAAAPPAAAPGVGAAPAVQDTSEPSPSEGDGEGASESESTPDGAKWLRFRAGRVELDLELSKLELSRDVVVQVDRYRLTSDELTLRRGPRGVEVEGGGCVAFCPCASAPVTIGFDAATVAPPTDLFIEDPTIRVGGVPVLWLPVLWLRAPDRLGMLPPTVAWRGDDGLLVGSGVHVPLSDAADLDELDTLDLSAGGYFRGGGVVDARLYTQRSTTHVTWDHLRQSLLRVDAHGSSTRNDGAATVAWRVDAIRGPRGREGTSDLEEAARRYDRAEAAVGQAHDGWVFGLGLRADAPRGEGLEQTGAAGPRGHVGYGAAVGSVGAMDSSLHVVTMSDRDRGAATIVVHRRTLVLDAHPGPLALEAAAHNEVEASSTVSDDGAGSWMQGRLQASLPLVRAFAAGSDPVRHWIEPFIRADLGNAASSGQLADPSWPDSGERVAALAGLQTALGRYGARGAGSMAATGGIVGTFDDVQAAVGARARARTGWLGLGGDAVWLPERRETAVAMARLRVGPQDGLSLQSYLEGRHLLEPESARWLTSDSFVAPRTGWLDRPGWTSGAALAVPWTRWLASSAAADYDVQNDELLGVRGATAYRHPCGCLSAAAWVGHRIGRPGLDAFVTVDLLP